MNETELYRLQWVTCPLSASTSSWQRVIEVELSLDDPREAIWREQAVDDVGGRSLELHFTPVSTYANVAGGKTADGWFHVLLEKNPKGKHTLQLLEQRGEIRDFLTGRRNPPAEPKSWFQKYGVPLLIGGMFLLNIVLKTYFSSSRTARSSPEETRAQVAEAFEQGKANASGGGGGKKNKKKNQ